jgi:hypothetical protein
MSVLASTRFIGTGGNNFSHNFQESFPAGLSRPDSSCPASVQSLSRSDSEAVSLRFSCLYRFATANAPSEVPATALGPMARQGIPHAIEWLNSQEETVSHNAGHAWRTWENMNLV